MHLFLSLAKKRKRKRALSNKADVLTVGAENIFLNSPSGHYRSNDKQQRDKQATCDTSPGFPREPVWLTDWQRRLQDQRDQGGRSPFLFLFSTRKLFFCTQTGTENLLPAALTPQVSDTPVRLFLFFSACKCVYFFDGCSWKSHWLCL